MIIETNIRQRGIGNPNPIKLGRCIKELERIYGIKEGRPEKLPKVSEVNQSDIAEMIGISVDTIQNYKKLSNLIPELQDWVETGILAPTTAIKIDEDLQDENSKLRALISNNFGRRKNDPVKDRKALATYVELKGYKHGEIGNGRKKKDHNGLSTLDEIAKELNMSKRNLQRALRIERNLTDSMKELLDTGEITKTFASDTIASLQLICRILRRKTVVKCSKKRYNLKNGWQPRR